MTVPVLRRPSRSDVVTDRFFDTAAASPHGVAVVSSGRTMTYGELADTVEAIAAAVLAAGATPDDPVGVALGQDASAVAGLLGVLAAGCPFVPLDPQLPADRLQQIARLAGVRVAVTSAGYADAAAAIRDVVPTTVPVDGLRAADGSGRLPRPAAGDRAVVLFTSGSTGEPKGVVYPHRTLLDDAEVASATVGIDADDRVGLAMPWAFAAGLSTLLWPLLHGAALHLYDPRLRGATDVPGWIAAEGITTLHATPSLLRAAAAAVPPGERLPGIRVVTSSGEPLYGRDVAVLRAVLPTTAVVVNWTGSSETASMAFNALAADAILDQGTVAAGRVAPGKQIAIVREDGSPAEPGEVGEVVITSPFLAEGYWHRPEMTATRFATRDDGSTVYRGGDLGRLLPDGTLRLHGRADAAVKIRGYLVEPAEVEAALLDCHGVREAVVIGDVVPDVGTRVVAYVAPAPGGSVEPAALRRQLRGRMPSYMVPSVIVRLPALPRNDRGKVDRPALPPPPPPRHTSHAGVPVTPWESVVGDLWSEVLHVDEIGSGDDFFALGGDSLAAHELLRRSATELGAPLSSSALVEAPTLAEFAALCEPRRRRRAHSTLVTLQSGGSRTPLFCVAGAGALALAFRPLARRLGDDQPVHALQSHGLENRGLPDWTVERAAARNIRTIRGIQPAGPYRLLGHSYGGLVVHEMAHQLAAAGERVELLALVDTYLAGAWDGPAPTGPTEVLPPAVRAVLPAGLAARVTAVLVPLLGIVRRLRPDRMRNVLTSLWNLPRLPFAGLIRYKGLVQFQVMHAHGALTGTRYTIRPWPGRAVLYVARDDVSGADKSGWNDLLSPASETRVVPGDHHALLREPLVATMAGQIAADLDALDADGPPRTPRPPRES